MTENHRNDQPADKPATVVTVEQLAALVEAARVNVTRGHFTELYEGFNDCPAVGGLDGIDESRCTCGYREAALALTLMHIELPA